MATLIELALRGGERMPWNEIVPLAGIGTQIYDTHESDLKYLVLIIEDLMKRTTFSIPEISAGLGDQLRIIEEEPQIPFTGVMELLSSTITNTSRELTCKPGENEQEKTLKIIKTLSNYSWKAKVALALAAFCIKYGKIRLLTLLFDSNPLARTVALLKQQPDVQKCPQNLKSWFNALAKLICAMLELTKRIVDFKEPTESTRLENQEKPMDDFGIPTAAYWTINSVVVCSSQIVAILVMRYRSLAPYEWNLDDLTKRLNSILERLSKQSHAPLQGHAIDKLRVQQAEYAEPYERRGPLKKSSCLTLLPELCLRGTPSVHSDRYAMAYQRLQSESNIHLLSSGFEGLRILKIHRIQEPNSKFAEKLCHERRIVCRHILSPVANHEIFFDEDEIIYAQAYEQLLRLFDTSHSDNIDILKAFVDQEDQPLLDGTTKERVSMDALKSKRVLLFISDLDLCHEELLRFREVFLESRTHPKRLKNQYEVVWLPVVDTSMSWKEKRYHFETIQSLITWYSIYYPSLISPAAIKYIKEVWQFKGKPLVVVLDSQGKVVNHNAIHMIRIWGSQAFPFTQLREEMLWKTEPCRIDFLVDSIDPMLTDWIAEYKYICLYGGEDKEWIQKFTSAAREVASIANIPLELLYMGWSCPTDLCQSITTTIVSEKLSHVIQGSNSIKFFWHRLESIIISRSSVESAEDDPLTRETKMLLNFDKDGKSWALTSRKESRIVCTGNGEDVLKCFMEYNEWKENAADMGFLPALSNYLHELQNPQNSNHPESPEASPGTHRRINSNFLWRSLSCLVDPPTK